MMQMVDRADPPSAAQVATLHARGVKALAMYVGGPNSGGREWHPDHAANMRAQFPYILPIYVGQNSCDGCVKPVVLTGGQGFRDGLDAVACAEAYGFDTGPLCLDIEYGTYLSDVAGALAYMESWAHTVEARGYLPVHYAVIQTASDYLPRPGHRVGLWIANWDGVGDLAKLPHADRFTGIGWQYADNDGLGDDLSHVDGAWWTTPATPAPVPAPAPSGGDPVTGKYIDTPFVAYFNDHGGVEIFGRPVTGSIIENGLLTQYFERNVFEQHAEGVMLRRLGAAAAATAGFSGVGIP